MAVSVFDLFKIGIGPSSSHTVGPMRAARLFVKRLRRQKMLDRTHTITCELYGSLGHTGRGHGTDKAVMLGLLGEKPDTVDPDRVPDLLDAIAEHKELNVLGRHRIGYQPKKHLTFHKRATLPFHANGMRFIAFDADQKVLEQRDYYSVGGGFVLSQEMADGEGAIVPDSTDLPLPFESCDELRALCDEKSMRISEIMRVNEQTWRNEDAIDKGLDVIWQAMQDCVSRGLAQEGTLPGGLHVGRRAPKLWAEMRNNPENALSDPLSIMDWVNLYALAVNEENAAGGRVVTAPTNGAAGIVPAVLHYYTRFFPRATTEGVHEFLLTAGAIGMLYKKNASISGAEVGCQGEVGVACSMAAGGLVAAMGGSMAQVENAAEIGMEHNLGLTCDPIGGLVQIPCIERNAMGAIKAINAQRMAMRGDGKHHVSLDKVIKTMKATGADMKTKYKETSRGGLAVNVIEC